jgi:hypothetical protein
VYSDGYGIYADGRYERLDGEKTSEEAILHFIKVLLASGKIKGEYDHWAEAAPQFAFDLYEHDLATIYGKEYHMLIGDEAVGYVLINSANEIVSFANGLSAYDNYLAKANKEPSEVVFIYGSSMYDGSVYDNGQYNSLNPNGDISG